MYATSLNDEVKPVPCLDVLSKQGTGDTEVVMKTCKAAAYLESNGA